jgi:hypothetical protein
MLRLSSGHAGSQVAPALLAAHWMGRQQQIAAAAAGAAPADQAAPAPLTEAYAAYAAAADPGRLEAFLAAKAEALAHLESSMQAVGGGNGGIAKGTMPELAAAENAAAAREASAAPWQDLVHPSGMGLARAALDAVRLDRGGAMSDWLADACRLVRAWAAWELIWCYCAA